MQIWRRLKFCHHIILSTIKLKTGNDHYCSLLDFRRIDFRILGRRYILTYASKEEVPSAVWDAQNTSHCAIANEEVKSAMFLKINLAILELYSNWTLEKYLS